MYWPNHLIHLLPTNDRQVRNFSITTRIHSLTGLLVDSLLNPCNCRSLWKCKCRASAKEKSASRQPVTASGLSALANAAAAAMECSPSSSSSFPEAPGKRSIHRRSPATGTPMAVNKHQRHEKQSFDRPRSQKIHLPPLLYAESSSSSSLPSIPAVPNFDFMPPIEQITSLAGSGCTCGVRCACPGCVEHRGTDHADHEERRNCADGCGTCVDPSLEFSLPLSTRAESSSFGPYSHPESSNGAKESFLDRFFARAAALPPPPEYRKRSAILDPMDTTLYLNKVGPPVTLPKLECCGGRCICPEGQCSCRSSCVGCSADEVEECSPSTPMQKASLPMAVAVTGSGT